VLRELSIYFFEKGVGTYARMKLKYVTDRGIKEQGYFQHGKLWIYFELYLWML